MFMVWPGNMPSAGVVHRVDTSDLVLNSVDLPTCSSAMVKAVFHAAYQCVMVVPELITSMLEE
jgi:hypothetical protein